MSSTAELFTPFSQSIDAYARPPLFTFPFYYEPHPLCVLASEQLQAYLTKQGQALHDFETSGKMFGVLLVESSIGDIGFLSGYSGKLSGEASIERFVPPVFDAFANDSFVVKEMAIIGNINDEISHLTAQPILSTLTQQLALQEAKFTQALELQYQVMADNRKMRKQRRAQLSHGIESGLSLDQLSQQSIVDKRVLKQLKDTSAIAIDATSAQLKSLTDEIAQLAKTRRKLSAKLQRKLFAQYQFCNGEGQVRDLNDIFSALDAPIPPSGAGECAAPKLLQYAYQHGLKPLALAEFWWGASPKSAVRQHGNYYPACQSKCFPILSHMLKGLEVDDNPLLENPAVGKELTIIFQDEHMLVINKPHDFLSVPGTHIKDSVFTRLRKQFPDATGPLIVHRLDMATSGLMLIALTPRANKSLAKQFATRLIEKQYVALIEGSPAQESGDISLPLRGDLEDRPRQLVCFEHGKKSETTWQVIERKNERCKVSLSPKTGRTHQLRVHCAHTLGLNMPIVGDTLYGKKADRLHLHARSISFSHPITHQMMSFTTPEAF